MRALLGVLFQWSLIKYVESFLGKILGSGKGYLEGNIVDLALEQTNG